MFFKKLECSFLVESTTNENAGNVKTGECKMDLSQRTELCQ